MFRASVTFMMLVVGVGRLCAQGTEQSKDAVVKTDKVQDAIASLASDVVKFCGSNRESVAKIKVDRFDMPDRFKNPSAGKRLVQQLSEVLRKQKIDVAQNDLERVSHKVIGTCRVGESSDAIVLQLVLSLVNGDTNVEIIGFRETIRVVEVSDRADVTQTLGLTVDATPTQSPGSTGVKATEVQIAERDKKFTASVVEPNVAITSNPKTNLPNSKTPQDATLTLIAPTTNSKFKLEILVRTPSGELIPVPASNANGLAVVGFNEKDVYAVRIYNDFDFDLAVRLSLDGINCFSLSEVPEYKRLGIWIIPRRTFATVTGWHKTDGAIQDFLVTNYPESVAKALGIAQDGIGIIQAQFFPAWTPTESPPAVELSGNLKGDGQNGLATGAGVIRQAQSQRVARLVGQTLLGAVTVRYSRPDLPTDLPPGELPKK